MDALQAAGGGLSLAFTIPHVVEQIGSIAGFAAVVGLAILSALYFSQARDLRRLREWAGRAPERAAEGVVPGYQAVPGRAAPVVKAVPRQQPSAQPQAGAAPAAATAAGAATATQPDQAGEAQAATNGSPPDGPGDADAADKPAEAGANGAAAGDEAEKGTEGDESKAGESTAGESKAEESKPEGSAPGPKPATPAGGKPSAPAAAPTAAGTGGAVASAPGGSAPTVPASPPATGPRPSALPPRTPTTSLPARRPPPPRSPGAQPSVLGPSGRGSAPSRPKRNPVYIVLAIAGVLILGAGAAIGVPKLLNGGDETPSKSATKKKTTSSKAPATAAQPAEITVSVLNGTTVPGLAAQVGDQIEADGFTLGTVSNASGPQRADSVAMYATGHQRDARSVARRLKIRAVEPVDSDSQAIAGDATVVVVVGSDQTR